MKKAMSVILILCFVLLFSGCGGKNIGENSSEVESTPAGNGALEDCAGVISVKINPEFKLFFDSKGNVLSLEAVNDDAKSVLDEIGSEKMSFDKTIESIITVSNQLGFIKDGATVTFEMLNIIDKNIDVDDILTKASDVSEKTAAQLNINIEINTVAPKEDNNSSDVSTSSDNSKHTHSFSPATCTEPEKCACGEWRGTAVGHKWQDATCLAPKTCAVCKTTEGEKAPHNFVCGVCTVCGKDNFVNPQNIEYEKEYIGNLSPWLLGRDDRHELVGCGVSFFSSDFCCVLEPQYSDVREHDYQTVVEYNGQEYYHTGAGMSFNKCKFESDRIIVYSDYDSDVEIFTLKLLGDNTILIVKSTDKRFPVNTILK